MKNARTSTHQRLILLMLGFLIAALLAACASASGPEFPFGLYKSRGGRILEFTEQGEFNYGFSAGNWVVSSSFDANGEQAIFGVETNLGATGGNACEVEGTYTWSYEEGELSFALIEDGCGDRVGDLDGVTYFPLEDDS